MPKSYLKHYRLVIEIRLHVKFYEKTKNVIQKIKVSIFSWFKTENASCENYVKKVNH